MQPIHNKIHALRGMNVMLDFDLAELYEVETKALNQAVKRNSERFPADFMFRLSNDEWNLMRSQFVTASQNRRNLNVTPFAFTEQGLAMLSGVLKSDKAIQVNIAIIRAFVQLRRLALTHAELTERLKKMEMETHKKFSDVYKALDYLLQKDTIDTTQRKRVRIGFKK
jgi:hypothetical protein